MLPPPTRLSSMQPIWVCCPGEVTSTRLEWCAQSSSADVVDHSLVTGPTVPPRDFHHLPRRLWSSLKNFETGHSRCAAKLVRWRQSSDPTCVCGASKQTDNEEHRWRLSID